MNTRMLSLKLLVIVFALLLVPALVSAAATTRPSPWDASFLKYDRPATLLVEESTPTAD